MAVWNGRASRIISVSGADKILIQPLGARETHWVGVDDLSPYAHLVAEIRLPTPADADPEDELRAAEWVAALEELAMAGGSSLACQRIAERMKVTVRTVVRHYEKYRNNPIPQAQLNGRRGPAVGSRRLCSGVERIIDEAIETFYLKREQPRVSDLCEEIRTRCILAKLPAPSRTAVDARIKGKDPYAMLVKRRGREIADALQKPSSKGLVVVRPLQVVQVDHALVDVIVVTEATRQEIGHPWITLAIDVFTRAVIGWYLSLDVPTQTSVSLCIEHACFPKRSYLRGLGLTFSYPVYGKPEALHWDNAWTFQAKSIQIQCERRGIKTVLRPVRKPHWGAYIERYIGTMMGKVHLLPGTTFSNTVKRRGYDSQKRAALTMTELKEWVATEIAQRYYHNEHKGLAPRSPAAVWEEHFTDESGSPRLPAIMADKKEFVLGFLPFKTRQVTREGIKLFGLTYWDPALTPLINSKSKMRVSYRQDDLTHVWLSHAGSYLEIPLADRTIPAFSHAEMRHAKRLKKVAGVSDGRHENQVADAVITQRRIEDEAAASSREARRRQEARPRRTSEECSKIDYSKPANVLDPSLAKVR
ncbi:Mu transposase C-terminal domain-containing protein [Luteimonas sp. YGD11-2]|uniref:Mu transposase C-terminal domain-containing protein n=1 Tax=Luteimonas sp. YGD11-2 TaxID=2508168 RepID=UPI00100B12D7|nr:Mu transposase C-terminal domain-containing protein [Luteimonas sp. YGD11-2]